jgi:hypothetical protein
VVNNGPNPVTVIEGTTNTTVTLGVPYSAEAVLSLPRMLSRSKGSQAVRG